MICLLQIWLWMNAYTINKRKTIKLSPQVLPSYTHHLPWHNHVFLVSRKIYRYNKIHFMMFMAWQAYFVKNFRMYRYTAEKTDIYDDDEPHVPMKTKPYHRQLWGETYCGWNTLDQLFGVFSGVWSDWLLVLTETYPWIPYHGFSLKVSCLNPFNNNISCNNFWWHNMVIELRYRQPCKILTILLAFNIFSCIKIQK